MRICNLSAILVLCATAGCSAPGSVHEASETAPPAAGRAGAVWVTLAVDPGARDVGAYEIVLRYDPAVIRVSAVRQAGPGGFPATPMSDQSTWRSGSTPILGFVVGDVSPGRVDVAVVDLEWVADGETSLSASVRSLYSPEGKPIPGTALITPARLSSR